jgi:nicotinamidase-related amidase
MHQKEPAQAPFESLSLTIPGIDFTDCAATALVVVDVQYSDAAPDRGWVKACEAIEPGSMRYYLERLERTTIPAIRTLLDAFRRAGRPVIHLATGSAYRDMRDCPARFREWSRMLERAGGIQDLWWTGNPDYAIREEVAPLVPAENQVPSKKGRVSLKSSFLSDDIDAMDFQPGGGL